MCDQIVREAITERNLIRRKGTSAQLGDLVGMHTATWIVCSNEMPDNDDLVVWTKRGCRQGCPLGGIAFNTNRCCAKYEQLARSMEYGKRSCTTRHSHPGTCLLKQRHVLMSTPCMTPETGSPGILDRNDGRRSSQAVQTSLERRQEGTLHFHKDGQKQTCWHDPNQDTKTRETMPKRKQTMHSQRTTN